MSKKKSLGVSPRKASGPRVAGVPSAKKPTAPSSRPSTRSRANAQADELVELYVQWGYEWHCKKGYHPMCDLETFRQFPRPDAQAKFLRQKLRSYFSALGARKAATKERVPAKRNRAAASLKGTGRSRAKATPKKKRA